MVVIEAVDGVDGLAKLSEIQPDAIITDLNMPQMDGFTFIERLRVLPTHALTPVVIMTTEVGQDDRLRAQALGVSAYVTKPIRVTDVVAAIKSVFPDGKPLTQKTRPEHTAVVLHVAYEAVEDLVGDYKSSLARGELRVANRRSLPLGTRVRLALSFPGLVEPLLIDGDVRAVSAGDDPTLTIALAQGPALEQLALVIDRIRAARR